MNLMTIYLLMLICLNMQTAGAFEGCEILEYEEFEVSAEQARDIFLPCFSNQDKFQIQKLLSAPLVSFEVQFIGQTISFDKTDFDYFGSSSPGEEPIDYCSRVFGVGEDISMEQNGNREDYVVRFMNKQADKYTAKGPSSINFQRMYVPLKTPFSKKISRQKSETAEEEEQEEEVQKRSRVESEDVHCS